ncbi:hypothetical protein PR048_013787 [Dryococelus australis]|uniref:Uncharacterized protein n=1 Tax=Dryococelus australis TaxID=614101 RepID=A0ABQ9HU10_9NEOP|nr:hypothetical protein PR048_013787 [Dryococelus australis]
MSLSYPNDWPEMLCIEGKNLTCVNNVQIEESVKDTFVTGNQEIFKGLGCFPPASTILTKPGAEPESSTGTQETTQK